jgi:hypothetical protein
MNARHKWWRLALLLTTLVVAAQMAVSLSARTTRVHQYLTAHLEKAFGRSVQVKNFSIEILPSPRIYATGVTVGEDPAFGYEYFLRAEHLTAGLRGTSFLRGRFEFGTLSLGQPSLTMVQNSEGRWNLEDWLPRTNAITNATDNSPAYGPASAPAVPNRLEKIEFEDGRINFKSADLKAPFALTGVTGNVAQVAPGRWKLQLAAQPWRSGIALQSAGTLNVRGDVAGTSARLRPASLSIRWDSVSLADLFRLFYGQDFGVRGTFAVDVTAKSDVSPNNAAGTEPVGNLDASVPVKSSLLATIRDQNNTGSAAGSDWAFSLKARATQIHRWDLTERSDNPKLTVTLQGLWNPALRKLTAQDMLVETPVSQLHGNAQFGNASSPFMSVNVVTAGIQASEVLSWYRAFQPGLEEKISAQGFFTGSTKLQGWPLKIQDLNFSSLGALLTVPGLQGTIKVGPFRGVSDQWKLITDPARISLSASPSTPALSGRSGKLPERRAREQSGEILLSLTHDFIVRKGSLSVRGRVENTEDVLKIASAFGRTINHGWVLSGPARADLRREWSPNSIGFWTGTADVNKAQLTAAGLNQPLQLQQARLEWRNGKRYANVDHAEGFGAVWSGSIAEDTSTDPQQQDVWSVQLHADHLDATELDRWIGPRARPGWLQRLLPTLLGGSSQIPPASELLRRLNVAGEVQVDEFTIEKLRLEQLHLKGALHDLHLDISDALAQWAGGTVRATMNAGFLPRPLYDVTAELDAVNLSSLPIDPSAAERLAGVASGTFRLKTSGIGREELLQKLTGSGKIQLANLEFRGWDVSATVADGEAHPGISRWTSGAGAFTVHNRSVTVDEVRLEGSPETTLINGTVSFAREVDLAVKTGVGRRALRNAVRVLKIEGPLDGPRISADKSAPRQPAD